jgi:hypothetical protein
VLRLVALTVPSPESGASTNYLPRYQAIEAPFTGYGTSQLVVGTGPAGSPVESLGLPPPAYSWVAAPAWARVISDTVTPLAVVAWSWLLGVDGDALVTHWLCSGTRWRSNLC